MTPEKFTPQFRVGVACALLSALRKAIEANGGEYSGALVPNIQSVHDALTAPDYILKEQIGRFPAELLQALPTEDQAEGILAWWNYRAIAPGPANPSG